MNELLRNLFPALDGVFRKYVFLLPTLQAFSLLVSGVLVWFVGHKVVKQNVIGGKRDKFVDKWQLADMSKMKVRRAWGEIVGQLHTGESAKMKAAITDADKMLLELLKMHGFTGHTFDERLAKADETWLANIKEVYQAHRFADRIKKEPTLVVTHQEAKNILIIYERAFRDAKLLE